MHTLKWWQSKTVWTGILSFLVGLPALIDPWVSFIPDSLRASFATAATFLAALAAVFAKAGGSVPIEGTKSEDNMRAASGQAPRAE